MVEKGLFCGTNKPKDPANLTDLEKEHIPVINCPDEAQAGTPFQLSINVGQIPHVMEEAHFIQWIDLYSGASFYARFELTPVFTRPEVTITLVKGSKHTTAKFRVITRCNLHGQWEAQKEVRIVQ